MCSHCLGECFLVIKPLPTLSFRESGVIFYTLEPPPPLPWRLVPGKRAALAAAVLFLRLIQKSLSQGAAPRSAASRSLSNPHPPVTCPPACLTLDSVLRNHPSAGPTHRRLCHWLHRLLIFSRPWPGGRFAEGSSRLGAGEGRRCCPGSRCTATQSSFPRERRFRSGTGVM